MSHSPEIIIEPVSNSLRRFRETLIIVMLSKKLKVYLGTL